MGLTTIRKAMNDLEINLAIQALDLHLDNLDCVMSAHAYIIGERAFTLQEERCG